MGIKERKERDKERRQQQIMVAAKRVFTDKGLSRTTMEDIAKEAELSPGTLYLYFKNKDDLYASLTLRVLQFANIRLEHVRSNADLPPREKLDALIEAMFDIYDFDPVMIISMFHLQSSESLKNLSPKLLEQITELSRKSLQVMSGIFQEGMDRGIFVRRHPTAVADVFWSLFSGVVLWEKSKTIIDEDKDFLKPTLETAFEIFTQGILA
jgi:AcrR family transcriptional regulator